MARAWQMMVQTRKQYIHRRNLALILLISALTGELIIGQVLIEEKVTNPDELSVLSVRNARTLARSTDNDVVVGTSDGAFLYYPVENEVWEVLNRSHAIYEDVHDVAAHRAYDRFFVLTSSPWGGLFWCFANRWEGIYGEPDFVNITRTGPNPDRRFNRVVASQEEPLLILGGGGRTLYIYNLTAYNSTISIENDFLSGLQDMMCIGNEVLVGSNIGFAVYNITADSIIEYPLYASEETLSVNSIEYDVIKGRVYLGTSHGVLIYSRANDSISLIAGINEADGIVPGEITSLELDLTTDRLYIGTKFGLTAYDLRTMRVRKNYFTIYPTRFQHITDLLIYKIGRIKRLIVASKFGGVASLELNNMPSLSEYIGAYSTSLLTVIGAPTVLLAIYASTEKELTRKVMFTYLIVICLLVTTMWVAQILGMLSIPNVVPEVDS